MFDLSQLIVFELRSAGDRLWDSVACDRGSGRWIVYANLRSAVAGGAEPGFGESARILKDVLDNRLSAKDWIAAVLCGDRVSYTITPNAGDAEGSGLPPD
jgi:hypothetical protein